MAEKPRELVDCWMDALEQTCPEQFRENRDGLAGHLAENWKVRYSPSLERLTIDFECFPRWIPDNFRRVALKLARDWNGNRELEQKLRSKFGQLRQTALEMIQVAHRAGVTPGYFYMPRWAVRRMELDRLKPNDELFMHGVPVRSCLEAAKMTVDGSIHLFGSPCAWWRLRRTVERQDTAIKGDL